MDIEMITALAGIPLGTLALFFMYRISSNHITHNTEVLGDLSIAIREQTKVTTQLYGWLRGRLGKEDDS